MLSSHYCIQVLATYQILDVLKECEWVMESLAEELDICIELEDYARELHRSPIVRRHASLMFELVGNLLGSLQQEMSKEKKGSFHAPPQLISN